VSAHLRQVVAFYNVVHYHKYVQELVGYVSIALTLGTYSHVLPGIGDGIPTLLIERSRVPCP